MYEEESPTKTYHEETYGEDVEYADFIDEWEAENWDPDDWASFFADVGAGYVVLTGEHHDGFPLWDTHYAKYNAAEMGPERDIVGDLADAVRAEELRFAASYHANYNYYQPGFDGQFGHPDYEEGGPAEAGGPGPEYVDFMNAKHRELVRKYNPDMLWFDVPKADSDHVNGKELITDYYNRAAERGTDVAVNDRASTDAIGPTIDIEGRQTRQRRDPRRLRHARVRLLRRDSGRKVGSPAEESVTPSATTRSKTRATTSRPKSWSTPSSTSSPRTATSCSTSGLAPTAPSGPPADTTVRPG